MRSPTRNRKAFAKAAMLMRFAPVLRSLTERRDVRVVFTDSLPPLMWPHHAHYRIQRSSYMADTGIKRPVLENLRDDNSHVVTLPKTIDPRVPDRLAYFRARVDMGTGWLQHHDQAAFKAFHTAKNIPDDVWYNDRTALYNFTHYEDLVIFEKARCDALIAADLDGTAANIRRGLQTYGDEITGLVARYEEIDFTQNFIQDHYRPNRHTWSFMRESLYFAALSQLNPDLVPSHLRMKIQRDATNKGRHLLELFRMLRSVAHDPQRYWQQALKISKSLQLDSQAALERLMPAFYTRMRIIDPNGGITKMMVPGKGIIAISGHKTGGPLFPNETASSINADEKPKDAAAGEENGAMPVTGPAEKTDGRASLSDADMQDADGNDDDSFMDLGEVSDEVLKAISGRGRDGAVIKASRQVPDFWGDRAARRSRKPLPEEDDGVYFAYDLRADKKIPLRDMPSDFVPVDARSKVAAILTQNRHPIRKIARDLARLFHVDTQPDHWQAHQEDGDIDLSALSRLIVDPSYPQPYKKISEKPAGKVAAIHLLVDISKTVTENPTLNIEISTNALVIASACDMAGIPCEITAITTGAKPAAFDTDRDHLAGLGRTIRYAPLLHVTIKPYDRSLRRSMPGLSALFAKGNGAADAASVLREHNAMLRRDEKNRFLIVVSDMRPESGYYFPSIAPDYDHFEGSGCAACARENTDHLSKVARDVYQGSDIHLIGLGVGEKASAARSLYARNLVLSPTMPGEPVTHLTDVFVPMLADCMFPSRDGFQDLQLTAGDKRPKSTRTLTL